MGYYLGDAMALYGYTYGLGLGFITTSFFSGVYGIRSIRNTDDSINYAVSGSLNGGMLVRYILTVLIVNQI